MILLTAFQLFMEPNEISLSSKANGSQSLRSCSVQSERKFESVSLSVHLDNYISISFQVEWCMIVVTDFLSILNQMDFHLVQNRGEDCHHNFFEGCRDHRQRSPSGGGGGGGGFSSSFIPCGSRFGGFTPLSLTSCGLKNRGRN